MELVLPLTNFK